MSIEAVVALITVMIALSGVFVSMFTLSQSARKDAFSQLQEVVNELKVQLKESNLENERLMNELAKRERQIEDLSQRVDAQDKLIASLKAQVGKKNK